MERKYSTEYGRLDYLPRDEYFSGDWYYVGTDTSDDEWFDIVRNYDGSEWRWTNI